MGKCLQFELPGIVSDKTLPKVGELRIPLYINENAPNVTNKIIISIFTSSPTTLTSVSETMVFYADEGCTQSLGPSVILDATSTYFAIVLKEDELSILEPANIIQYGLSGGDAGFIRCSGSSGKLQGYITPIFNLSWLKLSNNITRFNNASGITKGNVSVLAQFKNLQLFVLSEAYDNDVEGGLTIFNLFSSTLSSLLLHNSRITGNLGSLSSFPLLNFFFLWNGKTINGEYQYVANKYISGDLNSFLLNAGNRNCAVLVHSAPNITVPSFSNFKRVDCSRLSMPTVLSLLTLPDDLLSLKLGMTSISCPGTTKKFINLSSINLDCRKMPENDVDNLLVCLSNSTFVDSKVVTIYGTRTTASDPAVATLMGKVTFTITK